MSKKFAILPNLKDEQNVNENSSNNSRQITIALNTSCTKLGMIEKRFNEFVKLHEVLENKFPQTPIPPLPSKVSHLKTTVPPEKRQKLLIEYLN